MGLTRATVTNGVRWEIKPRFSQGGAPEGVAPYRPERGENEKPTSFLAGRGALPPQAVWRLAPYDDEPGENEKQTLSPAMHVVRTVNFFPYLLRERRG